jgi:hypothetical protein
LDGIEDCPIAPPLAHPVMPTTASATNVNQVEEIGCVMREERRRTAALTRRRGRAWLRRVISDVGFVLRALGRAEDTLEESGRRHAQ